VINRDDEALQPPAPLPTACSLRDPSPLSMTNDEFHDEGRDLVLSMPNDEGPGLPVVVLSRSIGAMPLRSLVESGRAVFWVLLRSEVRPGRFSCRTWDILRFVPGNPRSSMSIAEPDIVLCARCGRRSVHKRSGRCGVDMVTVGNGS